MATTESRSVMLLIDTEDRDILTPEIEAFKRPLDKESKLNLDYECLLSAIDSGAIADDLLPLLEHVLELILASGYIRQSHGPQEEQRLFKLYRKTSAGTQVSQNIKEVNQSIEALKNHKIENLSFSLKLPGIYTLKIGTEQCQLVLRIDKLGIFVDQLAVEV